MEGDILHIIRIDSGNLCVDLSLSLAGSLIVAVDLPLGFLIQCQPNALKGHIFNIIVFTAQQENAVFSLAGNILEADIADLTGLNSGFAIQRSQADSLRSSPPFIREPSGLHNDVGKDYIFHVAIISDLNGNSTVTSGNTAIFHQNIPEVRLSLRAEFDGSTGGYQGTIGDHDIFTGTVFLITPEFFNTMASSPHSM